MRRKRWTKGAWTKGSADPESIDVYVFQEGKPGAQVVARVPYRGGHDPEAQANAALIAASPDMFDALENFVDSFSDNGEFNTYTSEHSVGDLLAIAKNALQLAKGAPRRGWGKFADLARKLVKVPNSEVVEPKKPKRRKK